MSTAIVPPYAPSSAWRRSRSLDAWRRPPVSFRHRRVPSPMWSNPPFIPSRQADRRCRCGDCPPPRTFEQILEDSGTA